MKLNKLKDKVAEIEDKRSELRGLISSTISEAQDLAEGGEFEDSANGLVDLLQVIAWAKADIRELDNQANPSLVTVMDQMGTRKFDRGSLEIERKVSNYRSNWQNDVLIRSVVNTCLDEIEQRTYVDQDSGEVIKERSIVGPWMEAVIERLLECAAFRDWRVTALRAHVPGLNPDDFCDVKRSTKAVLSRKKG